MTEDVKDDAETPEKIGELSRDEFDRRRKGRNLAIGVGLAVFVIMIWIIGFMRFGPALFVRPI